MKASQETWQRLSDLQASEIRRLEGLCREHHAQLQVCRDLLGEIWTKYNNSFDVQMPKETFERIYEASK